MKEFIDKLISELKEEHEGFINRYGIVGGNVLASIVKRCMNIVNELAEEYKGEELRKAQKIYSFIKREINPYGKPFDGTVYEFGLKVMKYIENLHTEEYKGGWIACKEEMPEVGKDVLCVKESGDIVIAQWGGEESSYLDEKAVWFLRRGWCRKNHIIAWMPLPAPYTEGE